MRLPILGLLAFTMMTGGAFAQDISLRLPLSCEIGRMCFVQYYVDRDPGPGLKDHQCGRVTYEDHDGTDIRLPSMADQKAGIDVLAAADGKVLRTREGVADISVAQVGKDKVNDIGCGNAVVIEHPNGWRTAYCHMAKGSVAVRSGDMVKAGDKVGQVGLSGLTEFPHLHFMVLKDGKPVDPFSYGAAPEACGGGQSLWDTSTKAALTYQVGTVLNKGFAAGPVTTESIDSGEAGREIPDRNASALVAFIRAINLREGDVQTLALIGPDGKALAQNTAKPLDRDKAQWMSFVGLKRPPNGWPSGLYRGIYKVERDGKAVIEQAFGMTMQP